jgi:SAM-dependent methyltransferase
MLLNQVLRFAPAVGWIEDVPGTTLLDVGSGSHGVADLVSARWEITACDRDFSDYGAARTGDGGRARRVQADATALPFADRSFDVVVCLDVLEHVPPGDRATVLGELRRVAARRVVVGCPAGAPALEADRELARRLGRRSPGWLDEHLDNGFPEPAELAAGLGPGTQLHPNVGLGVHRALGRVETTPVAWVLSAGLAPPLAALLRRPGARRLLARADGEPSYRTFAVLDR